MTRLTCGERINVPMNTLRLFAASLFLVASSTFAGETQITHADGKEAVKLVAEKKVAVIDVRTPAEFGLAHIDGASNIDFNAPDFETKLKAIDKTKPVLVHCAAGGRSTKALPTFKKLGFTTVIHLDGGFTAYEEAKGAK